MIVVEHRLRDIISQIPTIALNADYLAVSPKFGWGNKKELNRYLELKKEGSYPLIWLLPSKESHKNNGESVQRKCVFIIAHLEKDTSLFNDERYLKSFDLILNPLTDYLVQGLRTASISFIVDDEWEIFKEPNYSETQSADEHGTIDLWDAIRLDCNIEITNDCLNTISWQNQ